MKYETYVIGVERGHFQLTSVQYQHATSQDAYSRSLPDASYQTTVGTSVHLCVPVSGSVNV
jgi:hypothetical protein